MMMKMQNSLDAMEERLQARIEAAFSKINRRLESLEAQFSNHENLVSL